VDCIVAILDVVPLRECEREAVLVEGSVEANDVGFNSCGSFISAIGVAFEVVEDVVSEY